MPPGKPHPRSGRFRGGPQRGGGDGGRCPPLLAVTVLGSPVAAQLTVKLWVGRSRLIPRSVSRDPEAGRLTGAGELCAAPLCSASALRCADLKPGTRNASRLTHSSFHGRTSSHPHAMGCHHKPSSLTPKIVLLRDVFVNKLPL
ncbi:hypothetical protein NDU88_005844 [Pleurodeles waltl]|uniref:Uncharacterized protein n=1 Tax=Pleurodeles waltl TaxID=8319 RepID=A0AAV7SN12_PLEWA|nr:hypothetical protein NDU88_005844 [Pleurodeles waltl]